MNNSKKIWVLLAIVLLFCALCIGLTTQIVYLIFLFLGMVAVCAGVVIVVCQNIKAIKNAQPSLRLRYDTVAVALIFLDMIYTMFNFGWCRYGLAIPLTIQSVLLVLVSDRMAEYALKLPWKKILLILNVVLYTVPRITLPDTLANTLYGFCGRIEYSEQVGDMVCNLSEAFIVISIVLLIVQLLMFKNKK